MQFLLSRQAQFAADLTAMSEREARLDSRLDQLAAKTDRVVDALQGLTAIVGNLASQQERTDQQVRDLARLFERHLREDHGQRPS
jgi:hypothetical protein